MNGFDLGDFISLIIVFAVYLTAASSGKKKKNKRDRRSPMRSRAQGERHDVRAARRDEQTRDGFGDAFLQDPIPAAVKAQKDCSTRQIHLHEVTQRQLEYAGEGEDPCHAGGYPMPGEDVFPETEDSQALAQDVLRGVIMSEILMRPQERAALRRGRR